LLSNAGEMIQTEKYMIPVSKLSIYVALIIGNPKILIEANIGKQWQTVDTLTFSDSFNGIKSYSFNELDSIVQFRITYLNGTGAVAIDDVSATFPKKLEFNAKNKWITDTTDTVINLLPETECFYKVRASNKTDLYEDITDYSNTISFKTDKDTTEGILNVKVNRDYSITVTVLHTNTKIYIYDILGRLILTHISNYNVVKIDELKNRPRGQIYILQAGNRRAKILL